MSAALDQAIVGMDARMADIQRRQRARAAQHYDRAKARLLVCADPAKVDEPGYLLERLENAVRAAEGRAASGHWAYDANHHLALLEHLEGERAYQKKRRLQRVRAI